MNLFGCKFCKNEDTFAEKSNGGYDSTLATSQSFIGIAKRCERKNFDSLLWALVTVFQVS